MATNQYFQHFTHPGQKEMLHSLIIESIKIFGYDVKYLPRTSEDKDFLLGEDINSKFNLAFDVEVYVKNVEGFAGQGRFLSNIGIEVRDQITFTVAKKRFEETIIPTILTEEGYKISDESYNPYLSGPNQNIVFEGDPFPETSGYDGPREGDLIYFGMVDKIFEIKSVNYETIFYQLGELQVYDLECEIFEYSSEEFNTDFSPIDDIEALFGQVMESKNLVLENYEDLILEEGGYISLETMPEDFNPSANNQVFNIETEEIVDWSEKNPLVTFNRNDRY